MSHCNNQGCHKMEHKEHGEKEFVDIDKVVEKDTPYPPEKMRPELRADVQGAIKSDLCEPGQECNNVLKKSEECVPK